MRMGSIGVQAIGSIMLPDKLVFVGVHHKFPVIASQCAHWRGNPPVERNQVTITTKNSNNSRFFGFFSVHFPSIRGIATPACALVRNDRKYAAHSFKHQFVEILFISSRRDATAFHCPLDFQQFSGEGNERRGGAAVFQKDGPFPVFQKARFGKPSAGLPGGAFAPVQ